MESAPAILTLHGTGVSAETHADSYKRKVRNSDPDYIFGVQVREEGS